MDPLTVPLPESWACRVDLPGWILYFTRLSLRDDFDPARLDAALKTVETELPGRAPGGDLSAHPVLRDLRELFKAAGTSPSRYRPSSEALARRVLKGEGLPRISPLVDFNNYLSVATLWPCCVMKPAAVAGPLFFRRGRAGERLNGLRGPFDLEGKPTLVDTLGPFGTPITDDHRVVLEPGDREALLVTYLPVGDATDPGEACRFHADRVGGIGVSEGRAFAARP